ncbi:MAG: PAS domain-containing protein [Halobacteriales archaeon]
MSAVPNRIRVLHVDDEPMFAETAAEFLERADERLTVETVESAEAGLDRLAEDLDCIVSDYDMPGQDGIEFLEAVRAAFPDLPFILFTGKGSEEIASEAVSAGVTDYLQKTTGTEQYELLANRITNTVAQRQAQTEARRQRDRLQLLFENFPEPTVAYTYRDGEPHVAQVNQAFSEVFGFDAESAVGEPIDDLVVPADRAAEADRIDEQVRAGHTVDEVLERQARDGRRDFWFRNLQLPDDAAIDGYAFYIDVTEPYERERQLERQNELFRKAQDIADVGAWEYDVATETLTWTDEVYEIHDLSADFDPEPEAAIEFYHPDDRELLRAAFERALERGTAYDLKLRLLTAADEERWVRTRGDPTVEDGTTVLIRGTIQDITEQMASAERIQALADSFPDLAFIIDETGQYVENLSGRIDGEVSLAGSPPTAGDRLHDDLPADRADALLEVVERTLETGEIQTIEYQLEGEAGPRWFEGRAAPLATRVGSRRAVIWVAREVTDRTERERVLRELHGIATELPTYQSTVQICERTVEAAESVLQFDNCLVCLADGDVLRVVALSDEFPAQDFSTLSIEDSLAGQTYRTGESYNVGDAVNHSVANPQGPYASGISVPIGDHGVCQMISEAEDAFDDQDLELAELLVAHTEQALDRLTREADLREQNKRLDEFASVVSHDLRNPLNVAEMALELAAEDCENPHLKQADSAIERSLTLVEDLLAVARETQPVQELTSVSLGDLTEECLETVETAAATVEIETNQVVRADASRLQQLLENLIRNAVDHGGEAVTVTIGDLEDGFYVADDGPGIPEGVRDHVVQPGYSTSGEGIGFGLYIVQDIAEAHGWDVRLTESDAGGAQCEVTGVELAD